MFEIGGETYFKAAHASVFCLSVRKAIMEFERDHMEYNKPWLRDWLWEQCHEELFCLKYLCKKAADLKNNAYLILFIFELVSFSKEATLPSFYHEFKSKLKQLNENRHNGKYPAILSMRSDENLLAERKALITENMQLRDKIKLIVQEENSKERQLLKEASRDVNSRARVYNLG